MQIRELVASIIQEYRENRIFEEWLNDEIVILFSDSMEHICYEEIDHERAMQYGKRLYDSGVPAGAMLMMIEKVQYRIPYECLPYLNQHKHILAYAYLIERLRNDRDHMQHLISDSGHMFTTANNAIALSHIQWLKKWIEARLDENSDPEMDSSRCDVGVWIHNTIHHYILDPIRRDGFIQDHLSLHSVAKSTTIFFEKKEYLYALELYLDLRSYTLRLREQFNFLFLREKLEILKTDSLTGLNNRFSLLDDLKENQGMCYVLINIRDFSKMNLLYGRGYGDEVITYVAMALRKYFPEDKIYRFYADEFAFLIDIGSCLNIPSLLKSVEEELEKNERILATVNFYGAYGKVDATIFDRSEYAIMSRHEHFGRFFNADQISAEEIQKFTENLTISQQLRIALSNDKVFPYFQPIVSAETGKVYRYEALMRFQDEQGVIHEPRDFLVVLERMYIYPEYTKSICKKVFEIFSKRSEGFSINFALSDIQNDDTRLFLFALFEEYPEAAGRCTIELLENQAVFDYKRVNDFFKLLKNFNVKSALDDFGAGFSNFAYLFNLHIDYIKIDGSIIQRLDDPKMAKLAKTIVTMTHELGIKTIAEFVSNRDLQHQCHSIGIDYLQGYAIGKPSALDMVRSN